MITPGIFDPDSFETPEDFRRALLEAGLKEGWQPIVVDPESKVDDAMVQTSFEVSKFLEHFGVKGMHWGVRRQETSSSPGSSSDRTVADKLAAKTRAAGGTHVLSNDELRKLNERLNLEANHQRLLHPGNEESGRKTVEKILRSAGKNEANKYAAIYAAKGAEYAVKWLIKQSLGTSGGRGKHG
jgi:hypothetical protein